MRKNRISHTFRALGSRNFRIYFMGQGVSLVGTWMQQLAVSWLIYRLTGSAFMLGLVGFSSQLPSFLLFPFAGVYADKHDRRRLLILTQTSAMVQALCLAVLVLSGHIAIWQIIVLSMFLGIINAFDMPTRQSFVVEMIDNKEDLGNAIALNSSMFNGARLAGPSIAGLLIAMMGEGLCFLLNGVSYLAVILSLRTIRITGTRRKAVERRPLAEFKSGFKYTFGFPPLRTLIILVAFNSLMGASFMVLLPVFAKDILGGGSHTLGFLSGAAGMGALAGALYLASRKTVLGLGRVIGIATAGFGLSLGLLSVSRNFYLSTGVLAAAGFSLIVQMASSNTVMQTIVEDSMRGRVMGFYSMAFAGMMPFGSLMAGAIAQKLGAPWAVMIGGISCAIAAAVYSFMLPSLREMVRPIYRRIGVIPEIAQGIHTADSLTILQKE